MALTRREWFAARAMGRQAGLEALVDVLAREHRRLNAARALARLRDAAPEAFADTEAVISFVPRLDNL